MTKLWGDLFSGETTKSPQSWRDWWSYWVVTIHTKNYETSSSKIARNVLPVGIFGCLFFLHFLFAPFLQRSISGSTCWKDGSAFSTHQLIDSGNWLQVFNLIWLYQSKYKLNRNQSIWFNPSCWSNLSLSYFLFNSDLMKRWKRI